MGFWPRVILFCSIFFLQFELFSNLFRFEKGLQRFEYQMSNLDGAGKGRADRFERVERFEKD